MRTDYSAIALGAMIVVFNAAAAGVSEDRIPELQREARTYATSATLTGCVAHGVAAGTYILTNIIKDEQTNAKDGLVRTSVLLSSTDVDVSKHVGHRVSVTGVYLSHGRTTSVAAMDEPAPTEEIARGDKLTSGTFRVKSLAMVADSCSQSADQSAAPNGKQRQSRATPAYHAAYREIARRRYRFGPELSNGLREDPLEHRSEDRSAV